MAGETGSEWTPAVSGINGNVITLAPHADRAELQPQRVKSEVVLQSAQYAKQIAGFVRELTVELDALNRAGFIDRAAETKLIASFSSYREALDRVVARLGDAAYRPDADSSSEKSE